MQNVPLFKEKNEVRATLGISNYQAAYAVTDHVGIMINGQYKKPTWSLTTGGTKYQYESKKTLIEGGAGYFSPIDKSGIVEIYAGGGIGNVSFDRSFSDTLGGPSTSYNKYSARTTRLFVQPSFGFSTDIIDIAISARFVGLKFSNIDTSGYSPAVLEENDLSQLDKPFYMFLEPAITFRVGWEYVKFHMQAMLSYKLNEESINAYPFMMNIGLNINIAKRYIKK